MRWSALSDDKGESGKVGVSIHQDEFITKEKKERLRYALISEKL